MKLVHIHTTGRIGEGGDKTRVPVVKMGNEVAGDVTVFLASPLVNKDNDEDGHEE